jgi:hypothetical protein
METVPIRQRKGVSIATAIAGMLITFIGGVVVGLHPAWIPIKGYGNPELPDMPVRFPDSPAATTADHVPTPQTQPATGGT